MKRASTLSLIPIFTLFSACSLYGGAMGFPTLEKYEDKAQQFGVKLVVPDFPGSPEEIGIATDIILEEIKRSGDAIAALPDDQLNFNNTFKAVDQAFLMAYNKAQPIYLVKNTSPDEKMREAASDAVKRFDEAEIEFNYREDIYQKLKEFAKTDPILPAEDNRLMQETMADYKRLGYDLPLEDREKAEALKKKISALETDFQDNIRESNDSLFFTADELEGVSESFLASVKTPEGTYEIKPNVVSHIVAIYKTAINEETRKRVYIARTSRAMDKNIDLLREMITTRSELAHLLGHATWADYRLENRMAKDGDTAVTFLTDLTQRLEPKFQQEMNDLLELKREDTQNPEAVLNSWDITYYQEKQNQISYQIDEEQLRQYFPFERCVQGLFQICETIFGIEITEIENPTLWDSTVSLYVITDTETEKPLGLFYLDPFPREGKYNHFAKFGIINGAELPDGTYQRPTVALVCNFPAPADNQPSLLSYSDVETLFHEFGHCIHTLLTESRYNRFSGTSVPRDFVEVPSQMLEYWLADPTVLSLFAANWKDISIPMPEDWVRKLNAIDKAHSGISYRKQMAFALMDLTMHHQNDVAETAANLVEITNDIAAKVAVPFPDGTAFVAAFGHLAGYDAGYYGYAWADVIAADFAKQFEVAPGGFLDNEIGMRLRKEVLEKGDSRDINESVSAFLGREPEMDAFIESLGLEEVTEETPEG